MPRYKFGDRVQLVGDIARFYTCIVGVIVGDGEEPGSVMNQYYVRLADGTETAFFDFQLQSPALITARPMDDTPADADAIGTEAQAGERRLHFTARKIVVHVKIAPLGQNLSGRITAGTIPMRYVLVTLFVGDHAVSSATTDDSGDFIIHEVPAGEVRMEVFVPNTRILVPLAV